MLSLSGGLQLRRRYDDSFKPAEDDGTPWLEGLLEGAQDALQQAEDRVSTYMAAKVPSCLFRPHILMPSPLTHRMPGRRTLGCAEGLWKL